MLATLINSRKPGVILAPHWKKLNLDGKVSDSEVLLKISEACAKPVAMAFVSRNIYLSFDEVKPITGLIASLMYHGEVGLDKIAGVSDSQVSAEASIIDLLARQVKVVNENGECSVGSMSSNLLMHGKKRMPLLSLSPKTLFDHAWLGCAFSYSREALKISSGAAAVTRNGAIYRGGAIDGHLTAREAVLHGMASNGAAEDEVVEWADCDVDQFKSHEWFSQFSYSMVVVLD